MKNNRFSVVIKRIACVVLCCTVLYGCSSKQQVVETLDLQTTVDEEQCSTNVELETEAGDKYLLTENEAAKKVQKVAENDCQLTMYSDGICMKFYITSQAAKIELLDSKIFVDHEYMYMYSNDGVMYRAPVGNSLEEHDGFSISTDIGSVDDIKGSVKEMFKSITKPELTDNKNIFSVKSTKNEFDEGYVKFEDDNFIKLELRKDGEIVKLLEPFYGNISSEIDEINNSECMDVSQDEIFEKVFELIFAAALSGDVDTTEDANNVDSNVKVELEYSTQRIYAVNENNKDEFAFNDTFNYEEYVEFCKESEIEQNYAFTDKYYYVDVVVQDRPFNIEVKELTLENSTLNETIEMVNQGTSGDTSAMALIVVLDEEPDGTSVFRQYKHQ